jgi:O-antigen ligase
MTATATGTEPSPAVPPPGGRGRAASATRQLHLALPGVLTAFLAFRAGGFFADVTALAVLVLAIAVLLRITVAVEPFAGWSRSAAVTVAAAAGLASWTLISAAWSEAAGGALIEFDRALLYTLLLALFATVPRARGDLSIVLRWVLAALIAAAVAGLASRMAADVFPIARQYIAGRLSFPLTYWNAMGMTAALGVVLAVHQASGAREPRWARVAATGALPALLVAVYFTFSRGAIVAGTLGVLVYVVLARPRRLLFAVGAAIAPSVVALMQAYDADALATAAYNRPAGVEQGHELAVVVALACLVAAALRVALLRLEDRADRIVIAPRRRRALLGGVAAVVLLAGTVTAVAIDAPARVDEEFAAFTDSNLVPATGDARDRLTESGNNGRIGIWDAAVDAWTDEPWHGTGAGTFRVEYERRRGEIDLRVTDAHSLYLEVLGELGIVGLVLLAVALLTPVAIAVRRLGGPERHAYAAFLAAGAALLVHAGVDWDWEMPALFAWFFAASGVVLAAPAGGSRLPAPPRLGRVLAGLACLLLAVTPWLVLQSQTRLEASVDAFRRGDCQTAIDKALASRDALSVRAEPFELLGYCDLRAGEEELAVRAMRAARAREPRNWRMAYGLAVAQAIAGADPRAAAALAERLNPREPLARDLAAELRDARPREWPRVGTRAQLPTGVGT